MADISAEYKKRKQQIKKRLAEFRKLQKAGAKRLFEELAFCMLTPQSNALLCDEAVKELKNKGLLFEGSEEQVAAILRGKARFHNKKARYLVEARKHIRKLKKMTFQQDSKKARQALVNTIKGIGLKEASHYLRNVGRGEKIAIIDRHILHKLSEYQVISMPRSLTKRKYEEIEQRMLDFCRRKKIPMEEMDLLLWSMQTGRVFK
ncbi:MAG: N-glycosylase/DNA lyase [Candidatus Micrarchaeota archaeon]|nr:N-glycosylase/DNA lyase [Candidatus Micrarchaeota archaeon]